MNKSKYAVLLSNFLIQGRSNKNVLQKYLQWKWLIWKEHCMSSKVFFLTGAKECSLFEAFEFCATSGFSVVILETIQAEPLATWITSHQTELCLFPFKHLLHLPLLIFTGQCLVWMVPPWRACYRDERLLISIFSIWKWNWSCVKFGWLSAICVKICAFTMRTSKQNHNSYCHHLFALWDVS